MRNQFICLLALTCVVSACSNIPKSTPSYYTRASAIASASTPDCSNISNSTPSAKIVWLGTYTANKTERVDAPESLTGKQTYGYGIKHETTTTNIVASQGKRMGIGFSFDSSSNCKSVNYKAIWRLPRSILNPNTNKIFTDVTLNGTCLEGNVCTQGMYFIEAWEMVPGTWTVEIMVKDQILLTQSFNVTIP